MKERLKDLDSKAALEVKDGIKTASALWSRHNTGQSSTLGVIVTRAARIN